MLIHHYFRRVLGQGAFGMVYLGTADSIDGRSGEITVAIKQLKHNADEEERKEFLIEIDMMKRIGHHPNIVEMYGCCTIQCPSCMVMEYVPYGDLQRYLQNVRKEMTYSLDPLELQNFALQVAGGMSHLESLGITHRDLAARNILVGHGKCLKISDFGLSRTGVYVKTTSGRIPLRWLSIEAIRDHVYSTASDVWAYGVVLWEICTLGGFPYSHIDDKDMLRYLLAGYRLEKPPPCSDVIYDLMARCWNYDPCQRPSFVQIYQELVDLSKGNNLYVEFDDDVNTTLPPGTYCRLAPDSKIDSIYCMCCNQRAVSSV
ncbi:unnamed protein product [Soboliphyme baturini]|uniref:Protein kinase domain-containing protein n=1 Tax=Soboliphyme baturini TaxID=241478 RepID=A0A183IGZ7_9BILA|nr:unnamed protein product [Soboliphyme baturini]